MARKVIKRKKKSVKKVITGKQKSARRKNIAVARSKKKSAGGGMSATKRKFIQSQSQKTLMSWLGSAKKRGDTKSVKELTPFIKKKRSDAAFKKRGRFLAARI
jgi:hypothetical protein